MKRMITLEGVPVEYELQFKNVKRINLRVHREGRVCVSANRRVPMGHIDAFLRENSDFILQNLERFRLMREAGDGMSIGRDRSYQDGECLYIGGEAYRLRVLQGKKDSVEVIGRVLLMTQKDTEDEERRKRMMNRFLTDRCREEMERLCRQVYPAFEKMGVDWPEIKVRSMVSRWGSCHPTRKILTFARQLVEVPEPCAEYVVVHEFAHFLHPDHSVRFHEFLDSAMPDWKERRQQLNERTWVH